jgi:RimJ/RimL family protein N-acetyltransferase
MALTPPTILALRNGARCVLRNARAEDAPTLIAFVKRVANESPHLATEADEFDFTIDEEKLFLARLNNEDNSLFLVAEVDGHLVGTLTLEGHHKARMRHVAELGVSVSKDQWGCGVGRTLLEAAIAWAENCANLKKISLTVHANNRRAVDLYLKLGFVKEGALARALKIDGRFYDCITMGRMV